MARKLRQKVTTYILQKKRKKENYASFPDLILRFWLVMERHCGPAGPLSEASFVCIRVFTVICFLH